MNNEKSKKDGGKTLYTLIPLEDFKGLLSIDDRDDRLARFCLVTSTHTMGNATVPDAQIAFSPVALLSF